MKFWIILKIVISVLILFVIAEIFAAFSPYNPLTPPPKIKLFIFSILPEGWGFFTKNPRDPIVYIYKYSGNEWQNVLLRPNSAPINFIGLKRDARAQGAEYGLILSQIPKIDTVICKNMTHLECLESRDEIKLIEVRNSSLKKTLCGDIVLFLQEPIPWAWRKSNTKMDIRVYRIKVTC